MKIKIERFEPKKQLSEQHEYVLSQTYQNMTLLEALDEIKEQQDQTLTYRSGCQSGVCGSCAVKINGVERLACKTKINDGDVVEPLNYISVIKDLVVDLEKESKILKKTKSFIHTYEETTITQEDEKKIDRQSNCILCHSCYSSCPVYEVNSDFLGPYALTRALRYVEDKKEHNPSHIIDSIQKAGVWDCTLCGNCTMVCPQFIDPKTDIMNLRMKSIQAGYEDPNMQIDQFSNEFNTGFDPTGGFNPSGGFNPNSF